MGRCHTGMYQLPPSGHTVPTNLCCVVQTEKLTPADRSGFEGPWSFSPTTFSNAYFDLLLNGALSPSFESSLSHGLTDVDLNEVIVGTELALTG